MKEFISTPYFSLPFLICCMNGTLVNAFKIICYSNRIIEKPIDFDCEKLFRLSNKKLETNIKFSGYTFTKSKLSNWRHLNAGAVIDPFACGNNSCINARILWISASHAPWNNSNLCWLSTHNAPNGNQCTAAVSNTSCNCVKNQKIFATNPLNWHSPFLYTPQG